MTDEPNRNRLELAVDRELTPGSLVGSFFHGQGGRWDGHQGCVVAEPVPGTYLVEFFSWLMGTRCQPALGTGAPGRRADRPMTARYFGGPLADHDAKPVRGRWPVFRDEHGEPIPTARGDAELADRTRPHRLYVHDEDTDTYVWAADWRRWRTRPRTAGDAA